MSKGRKRNSDTACLPIDLSVVLHGNRYVTPGKIHDMGDITWLAMISEHRDSDTGPRCSQRWDSGDLGIMNHEFHQADDLPSTSCGARFLSVPAT